MSPGLLTRHHAHHYRGFGHGQWQLFQQTNDLKPLHYTFRVLLTGIHLMRSGEIVADLPSLLELVPGAPAYLPDLLAAKASAEHSIVDIPAETLSTAVEDLRTLLDEAETASSLPEQPSAEPALHDMLIRLRLG